MSNIVLIYDPQNAIAGKLSEVISYRPKAKSFIARFDDVIILCNPAQSDIKRYIPDLKRKIIYAFIIHEDPVESLALILSTMRETNIVSNVMLISKNREIKLTNSLLNLFFRSLGIGYEVSSYVLKSDEDIIHTIVSYILRRRFVKKASRPIPTLSIPYFSFYVHRALEIFEKLRGRNILLQRILISYWYKYFGLFQERFPNWLKLLALILSFAVLDILVHKYINTFISAILAQIPIEQVRRLGSEVFMGLLRWMTYFLIFTPLISEIYYLSLRIKYKIRLPTRNSLQ